MTDFEPQNRPHARPKVLLSQEEVARVLIVAAMAVSAIECPENTNDDCPGCNDFRKLFWELSNSLDNGVRGAYQRVLSARGVPLPPAPWEDVDAQGNPT